jgi:hypothetical protein
MKKPITHVYQMPGYDPDSTWTKTALALLEARPSVGEAPEGYGRTLATVLAGGPGPAACSMSAEEIGVFCRIANIAHEYGNTWPETINERGATWAGKWTVHGLRGPDSWPVFVAPLDRCFGCGKQHDNLTTLYLGPEEYDVRVCAGRGRHNQSDKCAAMAIYQARLCAGCGRHRGFGHNSETTVCSRCADMIHKAARIAPMTTVGLDLITLDPGLVPRGLYSFSASTFADLLVDAVSGQGSAGRRRMRDATHRIAGKPVGALYDGMPGTDVMPNQVEPMRQLVAWVQQATNTAYQTGLKEGSSLLRGLAEGTLSASDFDAKVKP